MNGYRDDRINADHIAALAALLNTAARGDVGLWGAAVCCKRDRLTFTLHLADDNRTTIEGDLIDVAARLDRIISPQPPILDKTCWHCHRPFETRKPHEGLCPACHVLADEDTRVTKWED